MRDFCKRFLAILLIFVPLTMGAHGAHWIATWATSPQALDPDPGEPLLNVQGQTVRERVRLSLGGNRVRLRFSNECGSTPLAMGAATVALPKDVASVNPQTIHAVTFKGHLSVEIPAGGTVLSDPVALQVPYGGEISVSFFCPQRVATPTLHDLALKRAVVSKPGNQTWEPVIEGGSLSASSMLLSAVLVPSKPGQRLVVAFGDSVVDGDGSTPDADRTWPSDLVRRIGKGPGSAELAVVNAGLAGNRLLADGIGASALARFDRDVLALPGVTHLILLEGNNDICFPGVKLGDQDLAPPTETRTVAELTEAYRQLIARAHARQIKVIGATLGPFEGASIPGYATQAKDAFRQTVNAWIRNSGAFDAVLDFDVILRDPDHPGRIRPSFAYKDHLHPNDEGYQALADAIDLALFR